MADLLDRADEAQEAFMREAMSKVGTPLQSVAGIGFCLNCGEDCTGRWCDRHCRDDWQREQDRRRAHNVQAAALASPE